MSSYTLAREELFALLQEVGGSSIQGMADGFLTPLAEGEQVTTDSVFNAEALALAQLLARPHRVVHAIRFDPNDVVQESVWFYIAGDRFASLTAVADNYLLSAVDSLEALFFQAGAVLPLRSGADMLPARVVLDREDFVDVRYLLRNWHEVSGEMVLEAAGLKKFEAVDLAHSMQSEEWHGRLVFKFYKNDQLVSKRELRGLQSSDTCWLGYLDPETGKMVVQTATNETMDTVTLRIWEALAES